MINPLSLRDYGTDNSVYVPPKRIPVREQQEENPKETEKGESEKKNWPPKNEDIGS
jgi:hypothetical protein